ncbi:DUF2285 domain-containing protein [Mesorhizobium sp. M2A.F.Ca.ET.067.02.1.1]|uniref:DUF2285 domain-containing protein n=1 Tax=Mesorhizobium sp. M2A.F.Ca.ET.067.02.1.1 TaxID=2496749 RepID=UPI000FD2E7F5|nr:DUF2285 domain-containing protein [Mesorhizobium sp. M2A.F.Ca.ET.067.02.1.1]RUW80726.1 DUF2285 domain-containing protein [Mesorhizobium sp. M2A.F.Ca.ET.067.02.1.1]TIU56843.1 MAG: DUF2285 domain-containing protein [Mesorhizobium sp.]
MSVRLTSPLVGARDFRVTGDGLPLAKNIIWTEQASPRVLRTKQIQSSVSPAHQPVQLSRLGGATVWKADELHILWLGSTANHLVAEILSGASDFNAIVLPLDAAFETRLDAARQFWRDLNGRPPGPVYGALPKQAKARHILNLRAHDARRAGAAYREIAETLLSREPIAPRDWRDHHLRHRVRATLRRAERLVAGGYRDLLFYPHSRSRKSDR